MADDIEREVLLLKTLHAGTVDHKLDVRHRVGDGRRSDSKGHRGNRDQEKNCFCDTSERDDCCWWLQVIYQAVDGWGGCQARLYRLVLIHRSLAVRRSFLAADGRFKWRMPCIARYHVVILRGELIQQQQQYSSKQRVRRFPTAEHKDMLTVDSRCHISSSSSTVKIGKM